METSGNAATKIHIAYIRRDLNPVRYVYLDTSEDPAVGNELLEAGHETGTFEIVIGLGVTVKVATKAQTIEN